MPQRPRAHEIEELSKRDFRRRIPATWVIRDTTPDYGVDQQVEVFEDTRGTGLEFYVQLKATEQELPRALALSLPIELAEYYPSLALPVLMCRFQVPSGRMFSKWFHAFDPGYSDAQKVDVAKTFTFRWSEDEEWTDDTPATLVAEIRAFRKFQPARMSFPVRFHVETEPNTISAGEALLAMREVAVRIPLLVALDSGPTEPGRASLRIATSRFVANFGDVASVTVHRDSSLATQFKRTEAAEALMTIGLGFQRLGHAGEAAQVFRAVAPESTILHEPDVAFRVASAFAQSGRLAEALALARTIGASDKESAETTEMLLAATTLGPASTEELREEYRSVMRSRANRRLARGDSRDAASDFYNIGNSFRSSHSPRDALRNYIRAARLNPDYRSRMYFNHEVGGMLFQLDHFGLAAMFYGRALQLGADSETCGLYADALLYAGRYAEAEEAFAATVGDDGPSRPEWRLKLAALPRIRSAAGDHQHRKRAEGRAATELAVVGVDRSPDEIIASLQEALRIDALSEDTWLFLAALVHEEAPLEAAELMLVAALARLHDAGTWQAAFALEWTVRRDEARLLDIAAAASWLAGESFRQSMVEWARSQEQSADFDSIVDLLNRAQEIAEPPEVPVLRLTTSEGVHEIEMTPPSPE